jgi:Bacterial pre-peptidase C-terminal domain
MWKTSWTITALFAVLASWLSIAAAGMQAAKKIEQIKETGVFTNDSPKDKVQIDCPSKLYPIECVAGRTYTIELRSDEFDAYLRLEDANGKTIAHDDDSGVGALGTDAKIVFKADKSGPYTIAATSFGPKARGKFTFTVFHDGVGNDRPVNYLLDLTAKLTKDDPKDKGRGSRFFFKSYQFGMKENTTYVIQLDSNDFDAYLRLLDSDGKEVANDDDGAKDGLNAMIVFTCKQAGSYTIIATTSSQPDTGEFRLRAHMKDG